MGEWEQGLQTARERGMIDDSLYESLSQLVFERDPVPAKFPMRVALIVLGAILLVSAGFAIFVRLLGDSPSQVAIAVLLLLVGAVGEMIARLVLRNKPLRFLAGIVGSFSGVPLGFAAAVVLPGNFDTGSGSVAILIATIWSCIWFRRTQSGLAISAVVLEIALLVVLVGEWRNVSIETSGAVLCVIGVGVALASIIGRLKPSLPPLVASLIVVGWGCIALNTYGANVIAVIGIAISALLFLVSYRRSEALMSAATAVSTGVWAVVLTGAFTTGSLAPLVVAGVLGTAMIVWGTRRTRK